ncbi:MAG: M12 family metallo-peptidase [Bacteroidota bacterium]
MYLVTRFIFITTMLMMVEIVSAQQPGNSFLYKYVTKKRQVMKPAVTVSLFEKSSALVPPGIKKILTAQQILTLKRDKSKALYQSKALSISILLPYNDEIFELELVQEDIRSEGFSAGKLTGKGIPEKTTAAAALHYRGYVKNHPASIASLSVFDNGEIMCLFSNENGNYNLGKTDGEKYILYNSENMIAALGFECGTDETSATTESNSLPVFEPLAQEVCNKVRIYWEADYKLYNHNFENNFSNTINYLSGLFNQVATMYLNDGIVVELSEVFVWTTPDTFTTTSSSTGLTAIRNRWNALGNNFNGDLCMLIDGGTTNNGGRAYLLTSGICNRNVAYGYSNVRGNFSNVPVYSWDVEVITHETGHNMGSRHTHWCGWNTGAGGTCGAIDDCNSVETNSSCASCSATTITNPSAPVGFKGTVMSYCHLRSGIGINLANGFGTIPKAYIQSNVGGSSCLIKQNNWTGNSDTAWEKPANWSCGSIPTATTDVTIPTGLVNYPVIKSNAICRRLRQQTGSSVKVNPAFKLEVVGR